ncbi:hypothetical protein V7x_50440 [Crateriforma conspicua]|uniref:Secreted protein n=1 Tax=Crateriforma conspicua TaxID=2527996 RepID=A0A5C6FPU1_9PLAN|nr:hypothetical protein [Crateriforma conspicua]TWU63304.1 hypothetical protein V7x_50440 [Crateriforma conspicua]
MTKQSITGLTLATFLAFGLVSQSVVTGQGTTVVSTTSMPTPPASRWNRLADQIESNLDAIRGDRLPNLDVAKSGFIASLTQLQQYLDTHTSRRNRAAWMRYIDAQPLADAIENDESVSTIGRLATELHQRMVGLHDGLELANFRQLRTSTEGLIAAAKFADSERSVPLLQRQLELLSKTLREIDSAPSTDDAAAIGTILGTLSESRQVPDLIANVRSSFASPNFRIDIPERTVQSAVMRDVNKLQPVRDCILGTALRGTSNLRGIVQADLQPSIGDVHMVLHLTGRFHSDNVGYNKPVRLTTVSDGNVHVTRSLFFGPNGSRLSAASAQVSLQSKVTSIQHRWRLVRRIASKRAAEQKPLADSIAREKLRRRVTSEFVRETDQAASLPSPNMMSRAEPYLLRLDLEKPQRTWGSTDTSMFIEGVMADTHQLSADRPAPMSDAGSDASIQIHESVVENTLAPLLSGRSFEQHELDDLLEQIGLPTQKPADDPIDEPEEPFQLRFTRFRPIIFESRDQQVRLGLRGSEFAQGDRELRRTNLEIAATYVPARLDDGSMWLIRDGEVSIRFPGRQRLGLRESAIRSTLRKSFENVFPETLLSKTWTTPDDFAIQAVAGRQFRSNHIDARDGWLTIGVR